MAVEVAGNGVLFRLATDAEVRVLTRAQHGGDFHLDDPPRSYVYEPDDRPATGDEIHIVSQAFVDLDLDGVSDRWLGPEHHGRFVSIRGDATIQLLTLRAETEEDLIDLLADMRISQLEVTRWQIMSAPRRTEFASDLEALTGPRLSVHRA